MKIMELMIGDWVDWWHPRKQCYIPMKIVVEHFASIFGEDEIKPVSLTPEILEKNGFVLEEYSGDGKWWTRNDFVFPENMNDSVGKNNFKYEYVHQLQHALRLCGIKKEIQL